MAAAGSALHNWAMGFPDISSASNWIDVLKWLVPLGTSIVTAIIAVIVAIITYQQWRTNREKLRLDLYNRRFEVYLRCLDLYQEVIEGKPQLRLDSQTPFTRAFRESRFLFPTSSGVYKVLQEFNREAPKTHKRFGGAAVPVPLDKRQAMQDQSVNELKPLMSQLEAKLAPFLNFHDL
jgi:hypothetical protein